MAHKDLNSGSSDNGSDQPLGRSTTDHFARAADIRETEIKYLYKQPTSLPANDPSSQALPPHKQLLHNIKDYFANRGWIKHPVDVDGNILTITTELLSRQFDTPGQKFLKAGHTLRVRGDCPDGNLYNVSDADICIKTGKTTGGSGATQRGEYENHIADFNKPSLASFRQKYKAGKHPELDSILNHLEKEEENLVEFFRVDDLRTRYHMVIPESEHGIKGKNVVVELVTDELVYVSELLSELLGLEDPIFLDNNEKEAEIEVEAEIVTKPDEHAVMALPNGVPGYSDDLTEAETQHVMNIVNDHILKAGQIAPGITVLHSNSFSKAERGFHRFNEKVQALSPLLPTIYQDGAQLPISSLRSVFKASASNDNGDFSGLAVNKKALSALAEETRERKEKILQQRRVALRLDY